jgi:hypothetical protein
VNRVQARLWPPDREAGFAGAADDHPVLHADEAGNGVGCLAQRLLSFLAVGYRVSPVAVLPVAAMTLGIGTELLDGWRDVRRNAMCSPRRNNCLLLTMIF